VNNPTDERSTRARERTSSGLATSIKTILPETIVAGENYPRKLHILVVSNRDYKERRRKSNYGPRDPGKPKGVGLPTGGSEALEATDHVAERETVFETGYPVNRTIRDLDKYKVNKQSRLPESPNLHPHHLSLIDVDPDYVQEIREKDEIRWARWMPFCEIVERLKLGKIAKDSRRIDPEAFYYSHAKNFLIPFFIEIYYMTEEEIDNQKIGSYKSWIKQFRPFIIDEIDEHSEDLINLGLLEYEHDSEEASTDQNSYDDTPTDIAC